MKFQNKTNAELVGELKQLVQNERKLLMEILERLREVESRKLHLEMSYPDLYSFAMTELGYSSGAAYRRVSAMRLLRVVPEASAKLKSGELGLENASRAQSLMRKEDLRRKEEGEQKLSAADKAQIVEGLYGKSSREGGRYLMQVLPEVATQMAQEKIKALSDQKTLIQFVASAELMEKLEELKGLLAHQNFEGRMDVLIEILADTTLKKLKLQRKSDSQASSQPSSLAQISSESQSSSQAQVQEKHEQSEAPSAKTSAPRMSSKRTRYIPVTERRKILRRGALRCTYRSPTTGRVCGSPHGVQLDHVILYSLGGANTAENLQPLCGPHNRYRAEQMGLFRPV